jgi:anthranilate synthase component 1
MAAGVFGALGYDRPSGWPRSCPDVNPDPLGPARRRPGRPLDRRIFDAIAQEILLVTSGARTAARSRRLQAAEARLSAVAAGPAASRPRRSAGPGVPQPDRFTTPVGRERYREIVETAKEYVRAGDVFQVVPSHRFRAPFPHDPFALYRSLRRTNPSPFLFFLDFGDFHLAGSSPEILVRLRDGKITIRPLAGTRPRGATPEEDRRLEQDLIADPKERAEHLMLLDLGRNDVGPRGAC